MLFGGNQMIQVDIYFSTGGEVLQAYWGYVSGGGIIISRSSEVEALHEGRALVLHIHIGARRAVSVDGTVAKVAGDKVFVSFALPREAERRLLTAALAERDIDVEAKLSKAQAADPSVTNARMFVLSEDGCWLRLGPDSSAALDIGTEVAIEAPDFSIRGCVVFACERERGILFRMGDPEALEAVRACVSAVS